MDDAVAVRRAASEAIGTVEPARLRETLVAAVEESSTAPGVVVVASAHAVDGSVDFERLADRAAGVQLVYAGLRVTRRIAGDAPWTAGGGDAANLDVLAADILVARGAYLLAGTEASDAAVEVIRAFGRDQTRREADHDPASGHELASDHDHDHDHDLEADVLGLAVVAGATAVGPGTPSQLLEWADGLGRSLDGDGLPAPATLLSADPLTGPIPIVDDGRAADDGRVTSAGDR